MVEICLKNDYFDKISHLIQLYPGLSIPEHVLMIYTMSYGKISSHIDVNVKFQGKRLKIADFW